MKFTPNEIFVFLCSLFALTLTIVNIIDKAMTWKKQSEVPDNERDVKIESLEKRMDKVEESMKDYENHQKKAEEAWVLYMEALFDLINHTLDGNDTTKLKDTRDKMQNYLMKHNIT